MTFMPTATQTIHANYGFFALLGNIHAASRDRVEEVIGRGNLKWVLIVLLLLFALWYVRRQRIASP